MPIPPSPTLASLTPPVPRAPAPAAGAPQPSALSLLLESGLVAELYPQARGHGVEGLQVALHPGGGLTLACAGMDVDPTALEGAAAGVLAARGEPAGPAAGAAWIGGMAWEWLQARAAGFQVDVWESGRQWQLAVAEGVWLGRLARVRHPESAPGGNSRALRLRLLQRDAPAEPALLEREAMGLEVLLEQLQTLAVLCPGLAVSLRAPTGGLVRSFHYPHGPEQRVRELTWGRPALLEAPLVLETRWEGLRARCALQWCRDGRTRLLGYEDGRRAGTRGTGIEVLLASVRAGLGLASRSSPDAFARERLLHGLTAVVALDEVRAPQLGDLVRGSLSPEGPARRDAAFVSEAVMGLAPLCASALTANPSTPELLAWLASPRAPAGQA